MATDRRFLRCLRFPVLRKCTHLRATAYDLANVNAKWEKQSDDMFMEIKLNQPVYVPQVFYKHGSSGSLLRVAIKIVCDVLMAASGQMLEFIIAEIHKATNREQSSTK